MIRPLLLQRLIIFTLIATAAGENITKAAEQARAVSAEEAQAWIRHTVPLPKEIEIKSKMVLGVSQVRVEVRGQKAPALVEQGVKELRQALGQEPAEGAKEQASLVISFELGGSGAERLKDLPRKEQAYVIESAGEQGLVCSAIGPRGLYYASKTLQQLIAARRSGGRVEVPLARVTDWPDMEDRGLWGGDAASHLRWLSDRKMNYLEHISHVRVDRDGKRRVELAPYKQVMIDEGPTYGINPVPVILHLEQLRNSGLFEAYPVLQGKNATAGVLCYSQPKLVEVLADWLVLWGQKPGVSEVDVWMAENMANKKSCQCTDCRKEERAVLEAKAIFKAWSEAKGRLPKLGLRILTSEASDKSNPQIIKLLPAGAKFWYYHSLRTYNTSHSPMVRGYLAQAVKEGKWVGVCPNIAAIIGFWTPMSSAAFIHGRMTEFVGNGLEGLLGYATPQIPYCRFNTEAAAEWTWNARGRSPREFALSYAVRHGYKQPEKFVEWSETLGLVSWDVYGSEFPSGEKRKHPGKVATLLKEGKLPELGSASSGVFGIPWRDFKSVEQVKRDVEQAARAVNLAEGMGIPEYLHESLVVQGYMGAIQALWELKQIVKPEGVSDKQAARKWFQAYQRSLDQARQHLGPWEASLHRTGNRERMTAQAIGVIGQMIEEMRAVEQMVKE